MTIKSTEPSVAILLCTYNGARFLEAQLQSYEDLQYENLSVWISDDGSTDNTPVLLAKYRDTSRIDPVVLIDGPRNGFAANFLSLIYHKDVSADYYALSDQDDVWDKDKISRVVAKLDGLPKDVPALYVSRTRLVDANMKDIGTSPLSGRPAGFKNALVQSIGGANTMVLNNAARKLLRKAGVPTTVCHDWWTYLLVSGVGGTVIYDPKPTLSYRQHGNNLIGSSSGFVAQITRLAMLLNGRYRDWNESNVHDLMSCKQLLTDKNRKILESFAALRSKKLVPRVTDLLKLRLYRQSRIGTVALVCAAILNHI